MFPPLERVAGEQSVPRYRRINARALVLILFLAALVWAVLQAGLLTQPLVNTGGWPQVAGFIRASVHPDLSPDLLRLVVPSALTTLSFAVCGTTLSLLIGSIAAVPLSEVWSEARRTPTNRGMWLGLRASFAVPRAIHEAVWGLFFISILGLNPLVAVLAIAVPFAAITAKVFADILDETPRQALRALHASGAPPLAAFAYGLLPTAFPYLLSYALYRFECALRSAAVLGLIGAGGLGYQILLSLQSLRYPQVWTFLYALILLVGLTDAASSFINRRLNVGSGAAFQARERPVVRAGIGSDSNGALRAAFLLAVVLVPFSFWYIGADWTRIGSERTGRLLANIARDSFPPRLDIPFFRDLLDLSAQTLAMSLIAIAIAGLGGLLLSFPAASNFLMPRGLSGGARTGRAIGGAMILIGTRGVLLVTRALSESIWTLLVLFVLFPGVLPGAVGLGLYNLGVLGRLMAEVVENTDSRPLRALEAQGALRAQVFLYGVLPAALPRCVAYLLYRWEVCIRATAVVGIVGAGGLGRRLSEQITRFDYRAVTATLLAYILLTFLVDLLSALVRRTLR